MRILLFAYGCAPAVGGVQRHVSVLARGLLLSGHEVAIATSPPDGYAAPKLEARPTRELQSDGSVIYRVPAIGAAYHVHDDNAVSTVSNWHHAAYATSIHRALREQMNLVCRDFAPDVIHSHDSHRRTAETAAALFSLNHPVPIVNTIHTVKDANNWAAITDMPWDHHIVVSTAAADVVRRASSGASVISVVHPGIDTEVFFASSQSRDMHQGVQQLGANVIFLPSARLKPSKAIHVGVDAFNVLAADDANVKLLLCDSRDNDEKTASDIEYEDALSRSLERHGNLQRTFRMTFRPDEMAPAFRAVANSGVVIHPSAIESFGLVVAEAAACGAPVVASDIPAHREALSGQGVLVPPNDPRALAEAAGTVLSDTLYRARQRGASEERRALFGMQERVLPSILEIYEDVAAHAARRFPSTGRFQISSPESLLA